MLQARFPAHSTVLISLLFGVFAMLVGWLCAILPLAAALLMVAVVGAIAAMTAPLHWVTTLELFLATVIAGAVEYFFGISQAHWIPYLLALILGLRALMQWTQPTEKNFVANIHTKHPWFIVPLVVYFLTMIASVGFNFPPLAQLVVALKNYLFMWGVLLAFLAVRSFDTTTAITWKAVVIVACMQLPVVLYQKFFVASRLSNAGGAAGLSWDAISGTFGGGLLGGHSASMALFITIAVAFSLIAWRTREISLSRLGLICVLALPSVFFAEVKAVILWLIVVGFLVFSREIRNRPFAFLGFMLGFTVLVGGIAAAYKTMYYDGDRATEYAEVYEKQITYFFDPDKFSAQTQEIGRTASAVFWWEQHDLSDPIRMVLGHGLGSSRGDSSFAVGEVARNHRFRIDTSTVSTLLWDVGLLGLASFVGILFLGTLESYRLARRKDLPIHLRAGVECSSIGLFLILSGLIYNRDAIDAASVQFLMFFFLAILVRAKAFAARSPVE
ncbi:MAG: hypothetical protein L0H15_03740 [Nitrosospira sp.]|nr:hypothetical protein [Nitrosospira sp.]